MATHVDISQQQQGWNDAPLRQETRAQEIEQGRQQQLQPPLPPQVQLNDKAEEQQPMQSNDSIPSGGSIIDLRTDEECCSTAISTVDLFASNGTAGTSLRNIDMSDRSQYNWLSGCEWPQELSISAEDMIPPFEPMADFDAFDEADIMASELPELDGFFATELIALPATADPDQEIPYLAMSPTVDPGGDEFGSKAASELTARAESGYFSEATPELQTSTSATSSILPKRMATPLEPLVPAPAPPSKGSRAGRLQHLHRYRRPLPALQTSGLVLTEGTVSDRSGALSSHPGRRPKMWHNQITSPGRRSSTRPERDHVGSRYGKLSSLLLSPTNIRSNGEHSSQPSPALCSGQCHDSLIKQLSQLTSCWSSQRHISLDKLLNLDRDILQLRETVLQCACCMGSDRRSSHIQTKTLMFVIMVMENLLGLFERECNLDQPSPPESEDATMVLEVDEAVENAEEGNTGEDDEDTGDTSLSSSLLSKILHQRRRDLKRNEQRRQRQLVAHSSTKMDFGQSARYRRHRATSGSSGSNTSSVGPLFVPRRSSPPSLSALPQTAEPLLVGAYKVGEDVHASFSQYLLRLHFQRQMDAFHELDHILTATQGRSSAGPGSSDVSHRIACETLADIYRRVEYFLGFIAFVG
ncbi:hypothetical protein A1O3_01768 [Capronia epimyces CBS 606.96]|uniref:Aflatoxin regulatory protein domain-containing protein n=1 Tax=Capronia epimyces CBS 606.96 TaxID=1182542 RepID=W9YVB2_9EURO|nr:uncharacterized protein A1O3_01768 [Capronia epimyces CBS 606.96]EXJ93211.1 hypothetical protein A1O3_01768 [Capronia epimyces CBS 606.96]